jgi:hypothetical protein
MHVEHERLGLGSESHKRGERKGKEINELNAQNIERKNLKQKQGRKVPERMKKPQIRTFEHFKMNRRNLPWQACRLENLRVMDRETFVCCDVLILTRKTKNTNKSE